MRFFLSLVLLCLLHPLSVFAQDIAICGSSEGYSYDANRGLAASSSGWSKDRISEGKFTFLRKKDGSLDLLMSGSLGVSSVINDGAQIIPATISNEAVTIVLIYPNQLTETYVFQKLNNGKFQAMWTQAKAETLLPQITAFVSDCSYLNLDALVNN